MKVKQKAMKKKKKKKMINDQTSHEKELVFDKI